MKLNNFLNEYEKVENINSKWKNKKYIQEELDLFFSFLENEDISLNVTDIIVDEIKKDLNELTITGVTITAAALISIYKAIRDKYQARIDHCDQYDVGEDKDECIFKAKEMFIKYRIKILEKSLEKCDSKINMKGCINKIKKGIYSLKSQLEELTDTYEEKKQQYSDDY